MKGAMASIPLYNVIILFFVLVFGFLSASLSYAKAFKVNSRIINEIEKYEGFNDLSENNIDGILQTMGYRRDGDNRISCPRKDRLNAINGSDSLYKYCIYRYDEGGDYRSYGVMTFITFDIPIIPTFDIPIYGRSIIMYDF